jgi:hypothetical protein
MIEFDHLRLVRRQPTEVKRFRDLVLGAQQGEVGEVCVRHESNGRCCRTEAWNETARTLVEAMRPAVPQVMINLG